MAEAERSRVVIPPELPVLALRDVVVFPFQTMPLSVSRDKSIRALQSAFGSNRLIALLAQREVEIEDPDADDLHRTATIGILIRKITLPDERVRVLTEGIARARVHEVLPGDGGFLVARIERIEEAEPDAAPPVELQALALSVSGNLKRLVTLGRNVPADVLLIAANHKDPGRLADLAASHLDLTVGEAQGVLEILDPAARLRRVNELQSREIELRLMQKEITEQARGEVGKTQREYFLRQQLKAIQRELGETGELAEEIARFRARAKEARMPREPLRELELALQRLERMPADALEAASYRTYLEWLTSMPWSTRTRDNMDLVAARRILDEDHEGLEPVKERILEHLAVRKLKRRRRGREVDRSPLLCFVGPPGVGKTSLGRSIARALGRKFVRASLGGVRDEAEIRGHRRTYVGSMPGRILQGLASSGTANPVFMLDEVDKIGIEGRGDPAAALLEVLDPEQNATFRDHYLGVPFDLSGVLFIATANVLDAIHPAFLDRMEVIRLPGYTEAEKLAIARRYLLPRQVAECGLVPAQCRMGDEALLAIIRRYTREAGLRGLERQIGAVARKVAKSVALGKKAPGSVPAATVRALLGPEKYDVDELLAEDRVGVATGLALTASGGAALFVETTLMRGRGGLILTGQLGDVMKESARAALSYIRAHARELGIRAETFEQADIHVHIPAGATPKDGPSAGVTLLTSLVSALTGRAIDRTVALTGEITLRGEVLPVGGVKEKVLAARRAGVKTVLLPKGNARDLDEIPADVRKDVKLVLLKNVEEIPRHALVRARRQRRRRGRG